MSDGLCTSGTNTCECPNIYPITINNTGNVPLTQLLDGSLVGTGAVCLNNLNRNIELIINDTSSIMPLACIETLVTFQNLLNFGEDSAQAFIVYAGDVNLNAAISLSKELIIMSTCGNVTINQALTATNIYVLAPKGRITLGSPANLNAGNGTIMLSAQDGISYSNSTITANTLVLSQAIDVGASVQYKVVHSDDQDVTQCGTDTVILTQSQVLAGGTYGPVNVTLTSNLITITVGDDVDLEIRVDGTLKDLFFDKSITIITPGSVCLPQGLVTKGTGLNLTIVAGGDVIAQGSGINTINNDSFGYIFSSITLNVGGSIIISGDNTNPADAYTYDLNSGPSLSIVQLSGINIFAFNSGGQISITAGSNITIISPNKPGDYSLSGINNWGSSFNGEILVAAAGDININSVNPSCGVATYNNDNTVTGINNRATGTSSEIRIITGGSCEVKSGNTSNNSATGINSYCQGETAQYILIITGCDLILNAGNILNNSVSGINSYAQLTSQNVSVITGGLICINSGDASSNSVTGVSGYSPTAFSNSVTIISLQSIQITSGNATGTNTFSGICSNGKTKVLISACDTISFNNGSASDVMRVTGNPVILIGETIQKDNVVLETDFTPLVNTSPFWRIDESPCCSGTDCAFIPLPSASPSTSPSTIPILCTQGTVLCEYPNVCSITVNNTGTVPLTQLIDSSPVGTDPYCLFNLNNNIELILNDKSSIMPIACIENLVTFEDLLNFGENTSQAFIVYSGDINLNAAISLGKDLIIMSTCGNVVINQALTATNIYVLAPKGTVTLLYQADLDVQSGNIMLSAQDGIFYNQSVITANTLVISHDIPVGTSVQNKVVNTSGTLLEDVPCGNGTNVVTLTYAQIVEGGNFGSVTVVSGTNSTITITVGDDVDLELTADDMTDDLVLSQSITIITPGSVCLPQGLVANGNTLNIAITAGRHIIAQGSSINSVTTLNDNSGTVVLNAGGSIVVSGINSFANSPNGTSGSVSVIAGVTIAVSSGDVTDYSAGINSWAQANGDSVSVIAGCNITLSSGNSGIEHSSTGINSFGGVNSGSVSVIAGSSITLSSGSMKQDFSATGINSLGTSNSSSVLVIAGSSITLSSGSVIQNYSATGINSYAGYPGGNSGTVSVITLYDITITSGSNTGFPSVSGINSYGQSASNSVLISACDTISFNNLDGGASLSVTGSEVVLIGDNVTKDNVVLETDLTSLVNTSPVLHINESPCSVGTDCTLSISPSASPSISPSNFPSVIPIIGTQGTVSFDYKLETFKEIHLGSFDYSINTLDTYLFFIGYGTQTHSTKQAFDAEFPGYNVQQYENTAVVLNSNQQIKQVIDKIIIGQPQFVSNVLVMQHTPTALTIYQISEGTGVAGTPPLTPTADIPLPVGGSWSVVDNQIQTYDSNGDIYVYTLQGGLNFIIYPIMLINTGTVPVTQLLQDPTDTPLAGEGTGCTNINENIELLLNGTGPVQIPLACVENLAHFKNLLNLGRGINGDDTVVNEFITYAGHITLDIEIEFPILGKDLIIMSTRGNITINKSLTAQNIYILAPNGTITIGAEAILTANTGTILLSCKNPIDYAYSAITANTLMLSHSISSTNISVNTMLVGTATCNDTAMCGPGLNTVLLTKSQILTGGTYNGVKVVVDENITITVTEDIDIELIDDGTTGYLVFNQSITIITPGSVCLPQGLITQSLNTYIPLNISITAGRHIIAQGSGIHTVGFDKLINDFSLFSLTGAGSIYLSALGSISIVCEGSTDSDIYTINLPSSFILPRQVSGVSSSSLMNPSGIIYIIAGCNIEVNSANTTLDSSLTGINNYGNTTYNILILAGETMSIDAKDAQGQVSLTGINSYNTSTINSSGNIAIIAGATLDVTSGDIDNVESLSGINSVSSNNSGNITVISGDDLNILSNDITYNTTYDSNIGVNSSGQYLSKSVVLTSGANINFTTFSVPLDNSLNGINSYSYFESKQSILISACDTISINSNASNNDPITGNIVYLIADQIKKNDVLLDENFLDVVGTSAAISVLYNSPCKESFQEKLIAFQQIYPDTFGCEFESAVAIILFLSSGTQDNLEVKQAFDLAFPGYNIAQNYSHTIVAFGPNRSIIQAINEPVYQYVLLDNRLIVQHDNGTITIYQTPNTLTGTVALTQTGQITLPAGASWQAVNGQIQVNLSNGQIMVYTPQGDLVFNICPVTFSTPMGSVINQFLIGDEVNIDSSICGASTNLNPLIGVILGTNTLEPLACVEHLSYYQDLFNFSENDNSVFITYAGFVEIKAEIDLTNITSGNAAINKDIVIMSTRGSLTISEPITAANIYILAPNGQVTLGPRANLTAVGGTIMVSSQSAIIYNASKITAKTLVLSHNIAGTNIDVQKDNIIVKNTQNSTDCRNGTDQVYFLSGYLSILLYTNTIFDINGVDLQIQHSGNNSTLIVPVDVDLIFDVSPSDIATTLPNTSLTIITPGSVCFPQGLVLDGSSGNVPLNINITAGRNIIAQGSGINIVNTVGDVGSINLYASGSIIVSNGSTDPVSPYTNNHFQVSGINIEGQGNCGDINIFACGNITVISSALTTTYSCTGINSSSSNNGGSVSVFAGESINISSLNNNNISFTGINNYGFFENGVTSVIAGSNITVSSGSGILTGINSYGLDTSHPLSVLAGGSINVSSGDGSITGINTFSENKSESVLVCTGSSISVVSGNGSVTGINSFSNGNKDVLTVGPSGIASTVSTIAGCDINVTSGNTSLDLNATGINSYGNYLSDTVFVLAGCNLNLSSGNVTGIGATGINSFTLQEGQSSDSVSVIALQEIQINTGIKDQGISGVNSFITGGLTTKKTVQGEIISAQGIECGTSFNINKIILTQSQLLTTDLYESVVSVVNGLTTITVSVLDDVDLELVGDSTTQEDLVFSKSITINTPGSLFLPQGLITDGVELNISITAGRNIIAQGSGINTVMHYEEFSSGYLTLNAGGSIIVSDGNAGPASVYKAQIGFYSTQVSGINSVSYGSSGKVSLIAGCDINVYAANLAPSGVYIPVTGVGCNAQREVFENLILIAGNNIKIQSGIGGEGGESGINNGANIFIFSGGQTSISSGPVTTKFGLTGITLAGYGNHNALIMIAKDIISASVIQSDILSSSGIINVDGGDIAVISLKSIEIGQGEQLETVFSNESVLISCCDSISFNYNPEAGVSGNPVILIGNTIEANGTTLGTDFKVLTGGFSSVLRINDLPCVKEASCSLGTESINACPITINNLSDIAIDRFIEKVSAGTGCSLSPAIQVLLNGTETVEPISCTQSVIHFKNLLNFVDNGRLLSITYTGDITSNIVLSLTQVPVGSSIIDKEIIIISTDGNIVINESITAANIHIIAINGTITISSNANLTAASGNVNLYTKNAINYNNSLITANTVFTTYPIVVNSTNGSIFIAACSTISFNNDSTSDGDLRVTGSQFVLFGNTIMQDNTILEGDFSALCSVTDGTNVIFDTPVLQLDYVPCHQGQECTSDVTPSILPDPEMLTLRLNQGSQTVTYLISPTFVPDDGTAQFNTSSFNSDLVLSQFNKPLPSSACVLSTAISAVWDNMFYISETPNAVLIYSDNSIEIDMNLDVSGSAEEGTVGKDLYVFSTLGSVYFNRYVAAQNIYVFAPSGLININDFIVGSEYIYLLGKEIFITNTGYVTCDHVIYTSVPVQGYEEGLDADYLLPQTTITTTDVDISTLAECAVGQGLIYEEPAGLNYGLLVVADGAVLTGEFGDPEKNLTIVVQGNATLDSSFSYKGPELTLLIGGNITINATITAPEFTCISQGLTINAGTNTDAFTNTTYGFLHILSSSNINIEGDINGGFQSCVLMASKDINVANVFASSGKLSIVCSNNFQSLNIKTDPTLPEVTGTGIITPTSGVISIYTLYNINIKGYLSTGTTQLGCDTLCVCNEYFNDGDGSRHPGNLIVAAVSLIINNSNPEAIYNFPGSLLMIVKRTITQISIYPTTPNYTLYLIDECLQPVSYADQHMFGPFDYGDEFRNIRFFQGYVANEASDEELSWFLYNINEDVTPITTDWRGFADITPAIPPYPAIATIPTNPTIGLNILTLVLGKENVVQCIRFQRIYMHSQNFSIDILALKDTLQCGQDITTALQVVPPLGTQDFSQWISNIEANYGKTRYLDPVTNEIKKIDLRNKTPNVYYEKIAYMCSNSTLEALAIAIIDAADFTDINLSLTLPSGQTPLDYSSQSLYTQQVELDTTGTYILTVSATFNAPPQYINIPVSITRTIEIFNAQTIQVGIYDANDNLLSNSVKACSGAFTIYPKVIAPLTPGLSSGTQVLIPENASYEYQLCYQFYDTAQIQLVQNNCVNSMPWQTVVGTSTYSLAVDQPGIFCFRATDTLTGCISDPFFLKIQSVTPPMEITILDELYNVLTSDNSGYVCPVFNTRIIKAMVSGGNRMGSTFSWFANLSQDQLNYINNALINRSPEVTGTDIDSLLARLPSPVSTDQRITLTYNGTIITLADNPTNINTLYVLVEDIPGQCFALSNVISPTYSGSSIIVSLEDIRCGAGVTWDPSEPCVLGKSVQASCNNCSALLANNKLRFWDYQTPCNPQDRIEQNPQFYFRWTLPNSYIIEDSTIEIFQSGQYQVEIIDTLTGSYGQLVVNVTNFYNMPAVAIERSDSTAPTNPSASGFYHDLVGDCQAIFIEIGLPLQLLNSQNNLREYEGGVTFIQTNDNIFIIRSAGDITLDELNFGSNTLVVFSDAGNIQVNSKALYYSYGPVYLLAPYGCVTGDFKGPYYKNTASIKAYAKGDMANNAFLIKDGSITNIPTNTSSNITSNNALDLSKLNTDLNPANYKSTSSIIICSGEDLTFSGKIQTCSYRQLAGSVVILGSKSLSLSSSTNIDTSCYLYPYNLPNTYNDSGQIYQYKQQYPSNDIAYSGNAIFISNSLNSNNATIHTNNINKANLIIYWCTKACWYSDCCLLHYWINISEGACGGALETWKCRYNYSGNLHNNLVDTGYSYTINQIPISRLSVSYTPNTYTLPYGFTPALSDPSFCAQTNCTIVGTPETNYLFDNNYVPGQYEVYVSGTFNPGTSGVDFLQDNTLTLFAFVIPEVGKLEPLQDADSCRTEGITANTWLFIFWPDLDFVINVNTLHNNVFQYVWYQGDDVDSLSLFYDTPSHNYSEDSYNALANTQRNFFWTVGLRIDDTHYVRSDILQTIKLSIDLTLDRQEKINPYLFSEDTDIDDLYFNVVYENEGFTFTAQALVPGGGIIKSVKLLFCPHIFDPDPDKIQILSATEITFSTTYVPIGEKEFDAGTDPYLSVSFPIISEGIPIDFEFLFQNDNTGNPKSQSGYYQALMDVARGTESYTIESDIFALDVWKQISSSI